MINPHYEHSDNSVGAFIMFVIKDACEHSGLLPNKKKIPTRYFKVLLHRLSEMREKEKKLGELLRMLETNDE